MEDENKGLILGRDMSKVPQWVKDCINQFLANFREIVDTTRLSIDGINSLASSDSLAVLVYDVNKPEEKEQLERVEARAEQARKELERGLPLLHAQATIALWSTLESFIKAVVEAWLENYPGAMDVDQIKKMKVPLGEFMSMSDMQRRAYILETLERDTHVGGGEGTTGFERLLRVWELDGPVTKRVRDELYELNRVRNSLAHRRGFADEKLVASLPRRKYTVGQQIVVRHCCFRAYSSACMDYAFEVSERLFERFGVAKQGLPEARQQQEDTLSSASSGTDASVTTTCQADISTDGHEHNDHSASSAE